MSGIKKRKTLGMWGGYNEESSGIIIVNACVIKIVNSNIHIDVFRRVILPVGNFT